MKNFYHRAADRVARIVFIGALTFAVGALGIEALTSRAVVRFAMAQGYSIPNGTIWFGQGHVGGNPPVGTNCTITSGSTDLMGSCTTTTTSPTITFAAVWRKVPFCAINVDTGGAASTLTKTITATSIALTSVGGSNLITWVCLGP